LLGTFILFFKEFRGRTRLYTFILVVLFVLIGYVLANAMFLSQVETITLPEIVRTDGGDGHTAVLYFTHGEPPDYDPMPWITTINELDHDNVPFIPWLFHPFFFNTLRDKYLEAGGSPHNELHRVFIDNLRSAMPGAVANGTRFYLAFLDSPPHPEEMAIKAINEGASKIILLPVFTTESTHTIAGREMVESVNPEQYGVEVIYSGALGTSDLLQNVFVARANELSYGLNKSDLGILLVGHGQPAEWEAIYPEQNLQESQYREGIRDKLIADGYSSDKVLLGWMSFQDP
jgi:protoheme ferro-lyase